MIRASDLPRRSTVTVNLLLEFQLTCHIDSWSETNSSRTLQQSWTSQTWTVRQHVELKHPRLSEQAEQTRGAATRLVRFDLFSLYSGECGPTWEDDTYSNTKELLTKAATCNPLYRGSQRLGREGQGVTERHRKLSSHRARGRGTSWTVWHRADVYDLINKIKLIIIKSY